eukprot:2334831-Amphidinium_carterae.2
MAKAARCLDCGPQLRDTLSHHPALQQAVHFLNPKKTPLQDPEQSVAEWNRAPHTRESSCNMCMTCIHCNVLVAANRISKHTARISGAGCELSDPICFQDMCKSC